MGKFHNILKKLPHKSGSVSDDYEDITVRSKTEDNNIFFFRMKEMGKEHAFHNSTNVATWALFEAIEKADEK